MSCNSTPSADEQRQTIASLEQEEESLHVYCIAKDWYKKWQNYVGLNDSQTAVKSSCPGSLTMHRGDDTRNMLVDEKIWRKWVQWYGVADQHELDRRNWASDEKDFEICRLSPYSNIVENPKKTFDISEESGYIELQLRKIFRVTASVKSRLWACEKAADKRFQMVLDRTKEICFQDAIDHTRHYILALEVVLPDGSWPTHVPGEPKGDFDKYLALTEGPRCSEYWEDELASAVTCVFDGISNELRETVDGVVKTMKVCECPQGQGHAEDEGEV
ncbi:hypothetical protein NP493_661g04045 [Ridgeia piscesae]|uniref:DUSP domain-containing protein n=1 Tax=Ridgeia piscesae TaxID=27915 RepID=A0AAD9KS29_RIDPI|nr:hypothetical protein NP493_661g04045 [Ridgeia piscesae]